MLQCFFLWEYLMNKVYLRLNRRHVIIWSGIAMRVSVTVRPKLRLDGNAGKILEGRRRSVKLWMRRHCRRRRWVGVYIAGAGGVGGVVLVRQLAGVGEGGYGGGRAGVPRHIHHSIGGDMSIHLPERKKICNFLQAKSVKSQ